MGAVYEAYRSGNRIDGQCYSTNDLIRKARAYRDAPRGKSWGVGADKEQSRELIRYLMEAIGCGSARELGQLAGVSRQMCSRFIGNPHDCSLITVGSVLGGIAEAEAGGKTEDELLYVGSEVAGIVESIEHWNDEEEKKKAAVRDYAQLIDRYEEARAAIPRQILALKPNDVIAVSAMIEALISTYPKR